MYVWWAGTSRQGGDTNPLVADDATIPSDDATIPSDDGFTGQTTIFGKGRPRTTGLPAEHQPQSNASHRPIHGRTLCTRCSGITGAAD